jgi:hypothetical protein
MNEWYIKWSFDKPTYAPGENASVSFWLDNKSGVHLHLSDLKMGFDFGPYDLQPVGGMVAPMKTTFLGRIKLTLPLDIVGQTRFTLSYRLHVYDHEENAWIDYGPYYVDDPYSIAIYPQPLRRVFVSRGLWMDDRAIGDPIAEMIREWGFDTVTVGIEVQCSETEVPAVVRNCIRAADAVIAVATPRFEDSLTGLWKTLEWCHGEVGIAFGIEKPLLILKDSRISVGGLPSYLAAAGGNFVFEFDAFNLDSLKQQLARIMPDLRDWISDRRRREFFGTLGKIAVGGLAVVGAATLIGGATGDSHGTSRK